LVCLHEPDGLFAYLSPSCETVLEFHPNELVNTYPQALYHPEDLERVKLETCQSILRGEIVNTTLRVSKKSGGYIWLETLAKPITNALGQIVQVQTTSRDVTQRVLVEQQLSHDALHDTLTDLPNRALFMERVELALSQLLRLGDYQFAVLFIDLDRFKVINDSLGHLVGDRLLIAIASLLKSCLRTTDIVARLGGDEFTILLDDIRDFTEATKIAERIQDQLRSPFCLEGQMVSITASIGIVLGSTEYTQGVDILRDADIAMYRAKAAGKARYEIFDKAMHAQAVHLLQLESDLQQALQRNELRVYYQPIFSIKTGDLVGFETLIRWQHPQRGFVLPDEFVAIAEDSGLIVPIGAWILREACHQLKTWHRAYPYDNALIVNINLASKQIRHANFLTQLDAILAETKLEGRYLKLEITEGTLIESTDTITEILLAIRARNVQLSIDDFGIGYSSLSYLSRFPINTLKIDQSFIKRLEQDENLGIVRAIVTLAHTLGMDVVAEGIETQDQLNHLKQLNCEFAQGYLFAPALDAGAAEALIKKHFGQH
jgi:diguanylate cyclase (GGDEF)-like protein/PAS domain S-box-containing protein